MFDPSFILFYVENPAKSLAFYSELLGLTPVESSPTFGMFILKSGLKFGLWKKDGVEPSATPVGGSEICFTVADAAAVVATHENWSKRGFPIAQTPTELDFGHTFVALDPDGHRLRVFAPGAH